MLTDNMNNKINKTKTILFASLIVAMILPFSGMNYAEAESSKDKTVDSFNAEEARSILASKLTQANLDKSEAKDSIGLEKADRSIERIDIFSQLVDIKEAINNETDPKKIETLDTKAQKLILRYHNTIQSDEIEFNTPTAGSDVRTVASNSISFSTTQSRPADCVNPNTSFGYMTGNGDSYFNKIVLDYWSNYPSSVGTGGGLGGCNTHQGAHTMSKLSTISETCWTVMLPVSGTWNNITCNNITWLDVVLVENQAWYNGGVMYNAVEGWTIMVT